MSWTDIPDKRAGIAGFDFPETFDSAPLKFPASRLRRNNGGGCKNAV